MPSTIDTGPALAAIDAKRVLDLEQRSIRIPSSTFEEGNIADLYADYMSDIGLEVEMQQVTHPFDPKLKSRQPIGRLKGTGGGPTLLINGHIDPGVEMSGWTVDPYSAKFEDGWIGEWARTTIRAAASPRFVRWRPSCAQALSSRVTF